jgi:hypothetical protein
MGLEVFAIALMVVGFVLGVRGIVKFVRNTRKNWTAVKNNRDLEAGSGWKQVRAFGTWFVGGLSFWGGLALLLFVLV